MTGPDDKLPAGQSRSEVDAFLRRVAATPVRREGGRRGRLIFALDA
ncbi:MAG: VWA domain-containing protein, partial [Inquilinus limosus]|nr:VWA domain-containing protein [Inquilinus limosus]